MQFNVQLVFKHNNERILLFTRDLMTREKWGDRCM